MLQSIRDRTQGWIAGLIVSLLILTFAFWGVHSYFTGGSASNVVAVVNGIEITKNQLATTYELLRRQQQWQNGSNTFSLQDEAKLKQQALQGLVNIQVLRQASAKDHYLISYQQIDNYLQNMPVFQANGQFSPERFRQFLQSTLFTSGNDFFELIRTNLLIDQPRLGIILSSFSLPDEVKSTVGLVNQERDIRYLTLSTQSLLKKELSVLPEEINAYYKQHMQDYQAPEAVSVDYLVLSIKELMNTIEPTATNIKNYYNDNINDFTRSAAWQLQKIVIHLSHHASATEQAAAEKRAKRIINRLAAGEDFAVVAASESDEKQDAGNMAEWHTINLMPAELQKIVMPLTKVAAIGGPVKIKNNIVIVRVAGYREAQVEPFEKVHDKIKALLAQQAAETRFAELRDKLADLVYEHPESLSQAASQLKLTVKTTGLFTRDKGNDDITANAKIRDLAFSDEVLNQKNNSDVIPLNAGMVAVLHLKSHVPATTLSLTAVAKQIEDKIKLQKANEKAAALAASIIKDLERGATFEQVAEANHLEWKGVGYIQRYATQLDPAILDAAFSLARPTKPNTYTYADVKTEDGYGVVVLLGVKDGVASNREQSNVFSEQVQNSLGYLDYLLYKQSLMTSAKIKLSEGQVS